MKYDILDFGAVGDGATLNTEAFRRACDAARTAPDGAAVITVPPGVFVSGSIVLPSNTTLRLEAGAVLKASANPDDFLSNDEIFPNCPDLPGFTWSSDKRASTREEWLSLYFIGALHAHDVIIEGDGTIDGTGAAFWEDVCIDGKPWIPNDPWRPVRTRVMKPRKRRPVTVNFWKCHDIAVRGIRIMNAAAYTVWTQGCANVRIQDIRIRNPYEGPNTDALDIDCSENVIISGCDILAGDDCIALKSDTSRLGEDRPCRNIAVSNCVFSSTACGVRIGYEGDGAITDCAFSNLVVYDSKQAINLMSLTSIPRPDFVRGTPIERIQFTNLSMRNVARAFHIWCGTEDGAAAPYGAHVRDLIFSDINAVTRAGSFIGSKDGAPIRNVQLRNVHIRRDPHALVQSLPPADYPGLWGTTDHVADVLRLHRVENLRLDAVDLEFNAPAPSGDLLRWNSLVHFRRDNELMPPDGVIAVPRGAE